MSHPLYSLDASTIDLCLSAFPRAGFRSTKGAIKLHVGLNHAGYLPEFAIVTAGKKHDITVGRTLSFPRGSIVAIDCMNILVCAGVPGVQLCYTGADFL